MRIGKIVRVIREIPAPLRILNWPMPKPIPVPDWIKQPEKVTVR